MDDFFYKKETGKKLSQWPDLLESKLVVIAEVTFVKTPQALFNLGSRSLPELPRLISAPNQGHLGA